MVETDPNETPPDDQEILLDRSGPKEVQLGTVRVIITGEDEGKIFGDESHTG